GCIIANPRQLSTFLGLLIANLFKAGGTPKSIPVFLHPENAHLLVNFSFTRDVQGIGTHLWRPYAQ
ncbi:MAG: hypothetical protein AAFV25_22075, partial [Bacteroidota bacterium]